MKKLFACLILFIFAIGFTFILLSNNVPFDVVLKSGIILLVGTIIYDLLWNFDKLWNRD